ncbi:MAG TPA: hypothetical protein VHO48_12950 [Anaerolineaceae bacterium]|nr:hypothetical protein [Anaerolineaceae bacterium]
MKRAVSISIGASKRDKSVEIELLGEKVCIERIGTDGDMEKAARLYQELDGKVDAFGVGGADLGLMVNYHWYPLYSVSSLVRYVKQTPIVDGNGLKTTLEKRAAAILDANLGDRIQPRRVLLVAGVDRWGMAEGFLDAGYEHIFGDLLFTFGIPKAIHSAKSVERLAAWLMPIAGRIPFKWVYPVGKDQEKRTPKWEEHFRWATVIAGDCHYITRYMPDDLTGKIIVTNTTTPDDVALFRKAGVRYLMTTTPVLEGRSFGTNMMEAAILAASGRKEPVDYTHPAAYLRELDQLIDRIHLQPQVQELA